MSPLIDHEMIEAARDLMLERYVEGKHSMGSVLRTRTGKLFQGVHVEANNGRMTLCAEAVAIGAAATAGDTDIVLIVAVTESGDIVSPCGMCRELISDYAPDARVILEDENGVRAVPVLDLLPEKYDGSKYPNRRSGQCSRPPGASLQAVAIKWACPFSSSFLRCPGRGSSFKALSNPPSTNRFLVRSTVDRQVLNAAMMSPSIQPSSALNRIKARFILRAESSPLLVSSDKASRSSALNSTIYFFAGISEPPFFGSEHTRNYAAQSN